MPVTTRRIYYEIADLRAPWAPPSLPVIFHHGIGTTADIWSDWLPIIARYHRTIRYDTRGFGRSRQAWNGLPTMNALIDDLLSVADAAGEQRFHVIGESLGGTVAMAAAMQHVSRIASVVASNATHRGTGVSKAKSWRTEMQGPGMADWARDMMSSRFTDDAPISTAQRQWFDRTQSGSDANAIIELGELLTGLDMTSTMHKLNQPLLILSPDGSPFISAGMAAELQSLVSGSTLLVVPRTRHGLPFSHGSLCADAAQRFIAVNS